MRRIAWLLITTVVANAIAEKKLTDTEPWVEEEDLEEEYREEGSINKDPWTRRQILEEDLKIDEEGVTNDRRKREVYDEPYEEHIRVKRRCFDEPEYVRVKRSADTVRVPRQLRQYEVHEFTEDSSLPSSPPYEEMLAASAEHYHRVYATPGAPSSARYLDPDVSRSVPIGVRPVPFVNNVYYPTNQPHVLREFIPANPVNVPVNHPNINIAPIGPVNVVPVPVIDLGLEGQPGVLAKLDGDQHIAAGHHKQKVHHVNHAQGGGKTNHANHHAAQDGKSVKGFSKEQHVDKGGHGYKTDENHRKEYEEAAGKKHKHRDHADHKGSHEEEAHGHKGSKFAEKKGHKKGHKTKGYHNKYHKDEFHKEHKFYDDYHKSGEHHRYGKFNAKHASNESGKKKAHHVNAGHDFVEKGKKGYSNKGHTDADHKGYKAQSGNEQHKEHHENHGKKGGKSGGSNWGYAKKN